MRICHQKPDTVWLHTDAVSKCIIGFILTEVLQKMYCRCILVLLVGECTWLMRKDFVAVRVRCINVELSVTPHQGIFLQSNALNVRVMSCLCLCHLICK